MSCDHAKPGQLICLLKLQENMKTIKSGNQAAKGWISIGDQIRAVNGANGSHDKKPLCKIILEFLQKSRKRL